jgi:uncharacterized protein (TIGR00730 family)
MRRICVYCGSSPGADNSYGMAARALGLIMVQEGIGLVYGGGSVGLMGQIADEVAANGGEVIGVIPRDLDFRDVSNRSLADLRLVGSMHERKALMAELSDGFIALPGGFGTLDEMFEILTWSQLGLHHKPFGLLNVNGFYQPLLAFLDHVVEQQFIESTFRGLILSSADPRALITEMRSFVHPKVDKAKLALAKNRKGAKFL